MDDIQNTLSIMTKNGPVKVRPFGEEQIMAFAMMQGLSTATTMKIISSLLEFSLGADRTQDFIIGMARGEWTIEELKSLLLAIFTKSSQAMNDTAEPAGE